MSDSVRENLKKLRKEIEAKYEEGIQALAKLEIALLGTSQNDQPEEASSPNESHSAQESSKKLPKKPPSAPTIRPGSVPEIVLNYINHHKGGITTSELRTALSQKIGEATKNKNALYIALFQLKTSGKIGYRKDGRRYVPAD